MNRALANFEERAAAIKGEAARLRFDACGIAAARPVDDEDRFGTWLARGFNADMDWLAETKPLRQDVQLKLPGARSVIVVARNYFAPRPEDEAGTGRVSRYAWGRDYHRVLHKPLRKLAAFADSLDEDGGESFCSIDTGPVLEKAWAQRAGVGWIGKNGLVLRRGIGSWFFLGVILTTVELAADEPAKNYCGTCTRCMTACPSSAIVEPYVVDARRCLSYQTIENEGEVPDEFHGAVGDQIFGCDICQEACPWNRFERKTTEEDFWPRPGHAHLDLASLESMDEETFKETFAGSPIRRAHLAGMRRNAAIVRKNLGPPLRGGG